MGTIEAVGEEVTSFSHRRTTDHRQGCPAAVGGVMRQQPVVRALEESEQEETQEQGTEIPQQETIA